VYLIYRVTVLCLMLSVVMLTQGCVSSQKNAQPPVIMSSLIIAEPAPINYKSEIAIARLSEVISRVKITNEQKAQLFYDRGVLYDSVGLRSLARLDFSHALQLKPDLVEAYNFLGIHFTQLGEFSQAYEKFDSAIELSPEHEYAYLNRGIALYYGKRPELAVVDFEKFHYKQSDDPYRLLWLFIAEHEIDAEQARKSLKIRSEFVHDQTWAKQVIFLYLNEITQENFIKSLTTNIKSRKRLTDRLCEAYFYLGKYNQTLGYYGAAMNFFKMALSTNVYEFIEHRYARVELDLMRKKQVNNSQP